MTSQRARAGRWWAIAIVVVVLSLVAASADAQIAPITACTVAGIGATALVTDDTPAIVATILSVSTATAGSGATAVPYCLVKVLVPTAINIWVGLPMDGKWNGRLQSLGGGGYAGSVSAPTAAVLGGYVGITTDTGHTGGSGTFGMLTARSGSTPGTPNVPLQIDFAYRSEHLMAVMGKQLTQAFYGRGPEFSYWNGCSTGGRQGLRMAQDYPEDYDGILAGAPAIHWDRFQAEQIWPQVVQYRDNGGVIPTAKKQLATAAAVAACDADDGVVDGVLDDPRACTFDAMSLLCPRGVNDNTCLTATEASAINKIWHGATNERGNKKLWFGQTRGTDLNGLGGTNPFGIAIAQARFWVYFDPTWDWHILGYDNYEAFFEDTVRMVGPIMASDNPDLSTFRDRGGKLVIWHGFADQLITPEGSIDYYDEVVKTLGGGYVHTKEFARLFMAPGVAHCGGGAGPQIQNQFGAVVNWVEHDVAPETITASRPITLPNGAAGTRTRPLCPYPDVAVWTGQGSTDDAANFVCQRGRDHYPHAKRQGQLGPYRPAAGPEPDAQADAIANGLAPR